MERSGIGPVWARSSFSGLGMGMGAAKSCIRKKRNKHTRNGKKEIKNENRNPKGGMEVRKLHAPVRTCVERVCVFGATAC